MGCFNPISKPVPHLMTLFLIMQWVFVAIMTVGIVLIGPQLYYSGLQLALGNSLR
jgi:hypothetical protein